MTEQESLKLKQGDRVELILDYVSVDNTNYKSRYKRMATVRFPPRRMKNEKILVVCKLDGNFIIGGIIPAVPEQIIRKLKDETETQSEIS